MRGFSEFASLTKSVGYAARRRKCEQYLDNMSRALSLECPFSSSDAVFIDAKWDNPNHWVRYSLFRSALGLDKAKEIGILGPYRRFQQRGTLESFGISQVADFTDVAEFSQKNKKLALEICAALKRPDDLLQLELEGGVPAGCLYDYLLKWQKWAYVRLDDPKLIQEIHHYLNRISVSMRSLDHHSPKLILLSHEAGDFAPLAWVAANRGIPVVNIFGIYGLAHFRKYQNAKDFFYSMTCPKVENIFRLPEAHLDRLAEVGRKSLSHRMGGISKDIGARCSYGKDRNSVSRESICRDWGWDPQKPVVGVYSPNWYDYPHWQGMHFFRDFHEWALATVAAAQKNTDVNWIFKSHPVDDHLGAVSLGDVVSFQGYDHIKLAPKGWNGNDMMKSLDAIVTFRGTIGIEATSNRIPVMISEHGWYSRWGFTKCPETKEEFLRFLSMRWWEDMNMDRNQRLSQIFAGCLWGRPEWQKDFLLEDDWLQWELYEKIPPILEKDKAAVRKEIALMREWFFSETPFYQAHKMEFADRYVPYS